MERYKRIFLIVLDSFGIGAMQDSPEFGDVGVDTFGHIAERMGVLEIPNLRKLGLINLHPAGQMEEEPEPIGCYLKMTEVSHGKDTMTGHWEMMGLKTEKPFKTFTDNGFPPELIRELEERSGRKVIGNRSASGTGIIDELGAEATKDGTMIVYTSADSVLQICANEETFGLQNLYRCCEIARDITMKDDWKVGRVIARPFIEREKGEFVRTSHRRDYALKPFGRTVLNVVQEAGQDVIAIGKINDIFSGEGVTEVLHSENSVHGMRQTIQACEKEFHGLCFTNLVDFDAEWGHRRDAEGYAKELERFDVGLGELLEKLRDEDLLILTGDHGNDPTYTGSDHTREHTPFLAYSPSMMCAGKLADAETFAVIGATIAENFGVEMPEGTIGESILRELR